MFSIQYMAAAVFLFVIGNFLFGIYEGAAPMGFYAASAAYNPVYETYRVISQGSFGQWIGLVTNLTVFKAFWQMITWNYPILYEGAGLWVKWLILLPMSFYIGVSFAIMVGQLTRLLGRTS